jgi:hypothetical protein
VLALAAIAPGGCGQGSGGGSAGVRPSPGREPLKAPPARTPHSYTTKAGKTAALARRAAAKRWGLARTPLTPPPPPTRKPRITTRVGFEVDGHEDLNLPPVFTTVPTSQKIVFLTLDDGTEKDPACLRMTNELKIPYTAFLSDFAIKEDYGYFERMQATGVVLNNHTLHHPHLPALAPARQKREICGMQKVIEKRFGKRPRLFRPPYGNYDRATLRAAKSCGIEYAPPRGWQLRLLAGECAQGCVNPIV